MKTSFLTASLLAALTVSVAPAFAQSAGDWTLGVGIANVEPKDGNGTLNGAAADVGSSVRPTFTFEYFLRDNLGIEVLAALPFEHGVMLDGLGKIGSVQQLPPVVSVQYHFPTGTKFTPFVGAGINYTVFFNEDAKGPIDGSRLKLADSAGLALHAGFDYAISERGALRADIRWADIDSAVKLNGTKIGTAKIDPVVVGVSYVHRF